MYKISVFSHIKFSFDFPTVKLKTIPTIHIIIVLNTSATDLAKAEDFLVILTPHKFKQAVNTIPKITKIYNW